MIGRIAVVVGALILGRALREEKPRRVFVSYDHDRDKHYRYLLDAWSKNSGFSFSYDRQSPGVEIKSDSDPAVKRALTRKLKASEILLVLVGEETRNRAWVRWEIERATAPDVDLSVAAVKIGKFESPRELLGIGTSWATRFGRDEIIQALRRARPARKTKKR